MFVEEYVKKRALAQNIPATIIPDHFDNNHIEMNDKEKDSTILSEIQIQIEDFGGSFAMPHYGHSRPSTDYFNSNLLVQNFVVVDITSGIHKVIIYDEQAQGKDADVLCRFSLSTTWNS